MDGLRGAVDHPLNGEVHHQIEGLGVRSQHTPTSLPLLTWALESTSATAKKAQNTSSHTFGYDDKTYTFRFPKRGIPSFLPPLKTGPDGKL